MKWVPWPVLVHQITASDAVSSLDPEAPANKSFQRESKNAIFSTRETYHPDGSPWRFDTWVGGSAS